MRRGDFDDYDGHSYVIRSFRAAHNASKFPIHRTNKLCDGDYAAGMRLFATA